VSLVDHKNLKVFKQLGYRPIDESGSQVYGTCIFCGKKNKMFVNPEKKLWDCKSCGKEGGFKTLLTSVIKHYKKNNNKDNIKELAEQKSLPASILKHHDVLFNPYIGGFMLPIYAIDGKSIWDIRIYKNKKFMSLSGCNVGLFGWSEIERNSTIYLVEGEWDKMALDVMIQQKDKQAICMSVPGANTFKEQWAEYFKNKDVIVCYDNDTPGNKGANKVNKVLKKVAKSLQFIHWPENKKSGYDIRDFYTDTKKVKAIRFKRLEKLLSDTPPYVEDTKENKQEDVTQDSYDGSYVDPKDVYKVYRKWLYLHDTDVIDVIFGTIFANRLDGDLLWLFLVAPPGGTKTELVNTVSKAPNIVTTSSLTPKSLISGANIQGGGDPSLIPKLDGKVLVVKDFTPILTMNQLIKDEIFGILRDAYDGKTEKLFGNGVNRSYESHFGLISAVTPAIDAYTENNASLGERFLRYDIKHSTSAKKQMLMLDKVFENSGRETEMREEMSNVGSAVLSYDFKDIPEIPEDIKRKVMALAMFVAKMRGTVIRDKFTGEATHNAFSEFGTRMVKQFTKLINGVGMFKGLKIATDVEYRIACDMGMSTIPRKIEDLVRYMYDEDPEEEYSTKELVDDLKLPPSTMTRTLDNLKMLGLMNKEINGPGKASWNLTKDAIFLIEKSEIYN